MKLAKFSVNEEKEILSGILEGAIMKEYAGDLFGDRTLTGRTFPLSDIRLKAPLVPRHIIGIGRNFVAHGAVKPPVPEMPILFFKPLGTVVGPEDPVLLPEGTDAVRFESELAVIIGKTARNLSPEEADQAIFGYTVGNDLAAFDYFHPEGHWTVGKAFDTFCPLGPVIETSFDYRSARIRATVNGVEKQDSPMELIITPVNAMISYISRFMTLMPGDVLLTGTPAGAVDVGDGDVVDCYIEGIGHLCNKIQAK